MTEEVVLLGCGDVGPIHEPTKELRLQPIAQKDRVMRIYEGPSEVHRMSLARQILARVK